MDHEFFMQAAVEQAQKSLDEGGIPIGSVLVIDGKIVGRGHNQRMQKQSPTLHAEMDALESAGRLTAADYQRSTLYTTLSPCSMCTGAALLYKIPRIVIGENLSFMGEEPLLKSRGVEVIVLDNPQCKALMQKFMQRHPEEWAEDIGEPHQAYD
ncbi:nucleoside deaminase [Alteromonas aestuariivivens]|uniref:Nucleoside deaminase n=1 Tax=Alteromonas aestuariivivens TaxID=1938339 RepID=A0A3D8MBF4_9ALTE|nr:nucleoside deaminase [Alteromonas aestuariivivens]RDV27415.1 nucleoside deaminase [Alteromonas aestuariivivens]